mgnify:CR=1 FL=1
MSQTFFTGETLPGLGMLLLRPGTANRMQPTFVIDKLFFFSSFSTNGIGLPEMYGMTEFPNGRTLTLLHLIETDFDCCI